MKLTGADVIARRLAELNIDRVFGIVSVHNMPIFDAINRLGATTILNVRHEHAGAHAADGYARATGRIGVMITSTGPGTANTVSGLYEAMFACSRTFVITGQVPTPFYGQGRAYLHEAERQIDMLRAVTRRVESPRTVDQIADAFDAVVRDMSTGCQAPGALEIPIDLQYAEAPMPEPLKMWALPSAAPDVKALATRISEARRRVIIAGNGVICANASPQLVALAERLNAPVVTTHNGRGAIPEDHPLCVGNLYLSGGVYKSLAAADLTIAIGTSFPAGNEGAGAGLRPPGDLVHIDIDPAAINRTYPATIALAADAGKALDALNSMLVGADQNEPDFNLGVLNGTQGVRAGMRRRLGADFSKIMDVIREALPRDGIFVRDSTIAAYSFGNQLFPVYGPRTTMYSVSGAIGPGLPLALGAAVGSGKRTVLIAGDGGFMFHATEMATAAQYELPIIFCVFNDEGYGVLRVLQDERFGRSNNTELGHTDFAMMARSMGVAGVRVPTAQAFAAEMSNAMKRPGPSLIEIDVRSLAPMEVSMTSKKAAQRPTATEEKRG